MRSGLWWFERNVSHRLRCSDLGSRSVVPFGEMCSLAGESPTLRMGLQSSWPCLAMLSPAPAPCLLLDARPPLAIWTLPLGP